MSADAAESLVYAKVQWLGAGEVLRTVHREPLPITDPDIMRHLERAREGRLFHPIVVDGHKLVDGEHRLSLAYHRNLETRVPVLSVRAEGEPQMEKSKIKKSVQKSAKRPSDVDSFRTYSSPADAVDEAARRVYSDADEAGLADEVNECLRQNPGLGRFGAHLEVARRRGADNLQAPSTRKSEHALADSLTKVHIKARRANLNPAQRAKLTKASREAELTYLKQARPWAMVDDVEKSGDGSDLLVKAEQVHKADPNLSRFEAMRRAARGRAA